MDGLDDAADVLLAQMGEMGFVGLTRGDVAAALRRHEHQAESAASFSGSVELDLCIAAGVFMSLVGVFVVALSRVSRSHGAR